MNIENLSTIYQQGICHGLYKEMLCINFYQCSFKDMHMQDSLKNCLLKKLPVWVICKDKQLCTKQQDFYLVWLLNSKWDIFLNTLSITKTHRTISDKEVENTKLVLVSAAVTYMRPTTQYSSIDGRGDLHVPSLYRLMSSHSPL